jgi:4-diphosphocytidyl-2-C-methyl-D-erythritol kinase
MSEPRRARVRAFAKINLDLRVIARRPDNYHELRTVFQTISLADTIDLEFTPARRTRIELEDAAQIENNLVVRAAQLAFDCMRRTGTLRMRLAKKIPMGAGLGGGSSDAAAILLAVPVLAGRRVELAELARWGAQLGSDVPFFFLGGTAVGLGRGTELYPLPDAPPRAGVLVTPAIHSSTAEAYRRLSPRLTTESQENKIVSFQSQVWSTGGLEGSNDFEGPVFEQFPELASLKRRLLRAGARPAMMTGSGSSIFGLFRSRQEANRTRDSLHDAQTLAISLLGRRRYQSLWWRMLEPHMTQKLWPPQSRYAR